MPLIQSSSIGGTIKSGSGGSMVYAADGATYFMVVARHDAKSGADVFGTYNNFNKFAAADGKNPVSERATFYGILIGREQKTDSLPDGWQNKVMLFDLPRGAGASLTKKLTDDDLGLSLCYLDADGNVLSEVEDGEGNMVAVNPTVFKLVRDKGASNPGAMYDISPLPATTKHRKDIKSQYELPEQTLAEAIERLNGYAAKDLENFQKFGTATPDNEPTTSADIGGEVSVSSNPTDLQNILAGALAGDAGLTAADLAALIANAKTD